MTAERKFSLNFETVGSLVAMVIGASALFVAWDQSQVMRRQMDASVWPIVSADFVISGDEKTRFLEFTVQNAGVGPALVESVALKVDGIEARRWSDLEGALLGVAQFGPMAFNGDDLEGAVLAAGEHSTIMKGTWSSNAQIDAAFQSLATKYLEGQAPSVTLEVCYCSVFERCWRSSDQARSVPVKACPEPTKLFGGLFAKDEARTE